MKLQMESVRDTIVCIGITLNLFLEQAVLSEAGRKHRYGNRYYIFKHGYVLGTQDLRKAELEEAPGKLTGATVAKCES